MSKIVSLEAQNVQKIRAVMIKPDGSAVTIGGKNGMGKSSCLDAIEWALAGKRSFSERPVRDGEAEARIVCTFDDIVVTRRIKVDGGTDLVVSGKDGSKFASPQVMLDKLVGPLSFDPAAFVRMKSADQVRAVEQVLGVDVRAMDAERKTVFDERTQVNRRVRQLEAVIDEIGDISGLVDPSDRMQAIQEKIVLARRLAAEVLDAENNYKAANIAARTASDKVVQLTKELKKARKEEESATALVSEQVAILGEKKRRAEKHPTVDVLDDELAQVSKDTGAWRKRAESEAATIALRNASKQSADLTARLAAMDEQRTLSVRNGVDQLGLPALEITDGGVQWAGIPLAQCSSAEQIKIAVGIGLAASKDIRVVLVRDGAMLDKDSLAAMLEVAEQKDAQIWIERVGNGEECQVIIEDGLVAEDRIEEKRNERRGHWGKAMKKSSKKDNE